MLQASGLPWSWSINKQFVVKYFIVMSSYLNLKSNLWKNGVLKILLPIKQHESKFQKAAEGFWKMMTLFAFYYFLVNIFCLLSPYSNAQDDC